MFKKILLTILFFCGLANFCFAGGYENYNFHDGLMATVRSTYYASQIFKPPGPYVLYGVKMWFYATSNISAVDSTFTITLRQTTNGLPNSTILNTSTLSYYGLAKGLQYGAEYHAIFPSSTLMIPNTYYALVIEHSTNSQEVYVKGSSTAGGYGYYGLSSDSGRRWSTSTGGLYFITWGDATTTCTSSDMCICTTTLDYISNTTTGAGFWLDSSISLGDFLIASFLLGILVLFLLQFIFNLEIPKKVNFKRL